MAISNRTAQKMISLVLDAPPANSTSPEAYLTGWQWEFLKNKFLRSGIAPTELKAYSLSRTSEIPKDAVIIDSTDLSIEEVFRKILSLV